MKRLGLLFLVWTGLLTAGFVCSTDSAPAFRDPSEQNFQGFVWEDLNGDGLKDDAEPFVPGVKVQLYNPEDNSLVDVDTTDANGKYGVTPIDVTQPLKLSFDPPSGKQFTRQIQTESPASGLVIFNMVDSKGESAQLTIGDGVGWVHAGLVEVTATADQAPASEQSDSEADTAEPAETPTSAPSATPTAAPSPTATPAPTAAPDVSEEQSNADFAIPDAFNVEYLPESAVITFTMEVDKAQYFDCVTGEERVGVNAAGLTSVTYPVIVGADPQLADTLEDELQFDLTFSPVPPLDQDFCAGIGYYDPFLGIGTPNPEWKMDDAGTGSVSVCNSVSIGEFATFSQWNGSSFDIYSLPEESEIELSVNSYALTFPRWLLGGATAVGPTATDLMTCSEIGYSPDLHAYVLPLYIDGVLADIFCHENCAVQWRAAGTYISAEAADLCIAHDPSNGTFELLDVPMEECGPNILEQATYEISHWVDENGNIFMTEEEAIDHSPLVTQVKLEGGRIVIVMP